MRLSLPHMSKTALQAVLDTVTEEGVPELHSRKHQMEGLVLELAQHDAYGPLITNVEVATKSNQQMSLLAANGLSLIHAAVTQGGSFTELMERTLSCTQNGPDHLWNLCVYTDEAVPGNPLANLLSRKSWCIYCTFLESGMHLYCFLLRLFSLSIFKWGLLWQLRSSGRGLYRKRKRGLCLVFAGAP